MTATIPLLVHENREPVVKVHQKLLAKVQASRYRNLAGNSFWAFVGKTAASLLLALSTLIVARKLGPTGFGMLAISLSFLSVLASVVDLRVWEACIKYGSDFLSRNDSRSLNAVIRLALRLSLVSGMIFAVIAFFLTGYAAAWLHLPKVWVCTARILAIGFILMAANDTGAAVLRLADRFPLLAAWQAIHGTLRVICLLVALTIKASIISAAAAIAAASLVGSIILLALSHHTAARLSNGIIGNISRLRPWYGSLVRFLLHSHLGNIWRTIVCNGDVLLVGYLAGSSGAGLYRLARELVQFLLRITDVLYEALFPELAMQWVKHRDQFPVYVLHLTRLLAFMGVPASLLFIALVGPFLTLTAGVEFLPAATAARIMIWGVLWRIIFVWLTPTAIAIGRPQYTNLTGLVSAVVLLLLLVSLVPRFGIMGAAAAYTVTSTIGPSLLLFLCRRVTVCARPYQS